MKPFERNGDHVLVLLNEHGREFIRHGLERFIMETSHDQLSVAVINASLDHDDPLVVFERDNMIDSGCELVLATIHEDSLPLDEAEVWFRTLSLLSSCAAKALGALGPEGPSALSEDDRQLVQTFTYLVASLVHALDPNLDV